VRRTLPPSAEIEVQIDQLLAVGVGENPRESLSVLAKLGARLIIQRAVEDEFDAWLGRARYERRPDYQRGLRNYESGLRNGFARAGCRPRRGSWRSRSRRSARRPSRLCRRCSRMRRSCCARGRWRRWWLAPSSAGCRCETSSRCVRRRGWASSPSRPRRGSAPSCATASSSSGAATSTGSDWWRCSSTRSCSTSGRRARRRVSFAPGALARSVVSAG
jgi:hypothetical protein